MACWSAVCQICRSASEDAPSGPIDVNVGGFRFAVSLATLARAPKDSCLHRLLSSPPLRDGSYFLDRDGRHFHFVLNFLRDGPDAFCAPKDSQTRKELQNEAAFLGLHDLAELMDDTYHGAPIPSNEQERIAALDSLEIMHTYDHEPHYDSITRIVATLLQVPIVLISLVHSDHQWFKSRCGLDATSTPRNTSFCAFSFEPVLPNKASMFVIENAHSDPLVAKNPLVLGPPYIVFYAGTPLVTSDGIRLGALCAIDRVARRLSMREAQLLINFSMLVVGEIERIQLTSCVRREDNNDYPDAELEFSAGPFRADRMKESLDEGVILMYISDNNECCPLLYANKVWENVTGVTISPPDSIPNKAVASGGGVPWDTHKYPNRSPCLEDFFQADGKRWEDYISEMRTACEPRDPRCVCIKGRLVVVRSGSDPLHIPVSARVTPIDIPLDVNAAAVQPVASTPSSNSFHTDRLRNLVGGLLCFVQFASTSIEWRQKTADLMQPMATPIPFMDKTPNARQTPSTRPATALSNKNGIHAESDPYRQISHDSSKTVDSIRPPRSPFDDVRLLRLLGEGSFGKVYYGLWTGAPVAVKVIRTSSARSKLLEPIFEGAISSAVAHPYLVQTYQYCSREVPGQNQIEGSDGFETWIVQEWCDRGNLSKFCSKLKKKPECIVEALEIVKEVAGAGAYLHQRGIIHGDLTGNNVLIKTDISRKGYTCKICDFGLARILEGETCEIVTTQIGTVTHMPPELFQLEQSEMKLTRKADIWAAGVILWQTLTGKSPFEGMSPPQVIVQVAAGRRLQLPEDAPASIKDIFERCCATDPEKRPDFDELLSLLVGAIEGHELSRQSKQ